MRRHLVKRGRRSTGVGLKSKMVPELGNYLMRGGPSGWIAARGGAEIGAVGVVCHNGGKLFTTFCRNVCQPCGSGNGFAPG